MPKGVASRRQVTRPSKVVLQPLLTAYLGNGILANLQNLEKNRDLLGGATLQHRAISEMSPSGHIGVATSFS